MESDLNSRAGASGRVRSRDPYGTTKDGGWSSRKDQHMADAEQVRDALLDAILQQASTQSATNVLSLAQAYALVAGPRESPPHAATRDEEDRPHAPEPEA
jgi:hypothetical protein